MLLLDRYLLRNFLTPLCLCVFGFLAIWLVFDLQGNSANFVEGGVSLGWIAHYYLLQIPQFLMLCLPVGLLLALLFCLSKMSRANEIMAMLTAGRSLHRLLVPLVLAGVALTGLCLWLNYKLAPHANAAQKDLKAEIKGDRARDRHLYLSAHVFPNRADNRVWFVQRMEAKATPRTPLENVIILEQDARGTILHKWVAREARYLAKRGLWLLKDGAALQYAPDGTLQGRKPFERLEIKNWSETPWRIASSRMDPAGMSVPELRDYLRYNASFSPGQLAPFRTHWHYRWSLPFQCLAIVLFTAPLAIVFSRRGVFGGIAGAIFLFIGLVLLERLLIASAKGGLLNPALAAWGAVGVCASMGLYFIYLRGTNRELPRPRGLLAALLCICLLGPLGVVLICLMDDKRVWSKPGERPRLK